jgi:hypothetical protein
MPGSVRKQPQAQQAADKLAQEIQQLVRWGQAARSPMIMGWLLHTMQACKAGSFGRGASPACR